MKFKVGDKVRVKDVLPDTSTAFKKDYCGETFQIRDIYPDEANPYSLGTTFVWNDNELDLVVETVDTAEAIAPKDIRKGDRIRSTFHWPNLDFTETKEFVVFDIEDHSESTSGYKYVLISSTNKDGTEGDSVSYALVDSVQISWFLLDRPVTPLKVGDTVTKENWKTLPKGTWIRRVDHRTDEVDYIRQGTFTWGEIGMKLYHNVTVVELPQ